jgi:endonuclease III
MGSGAIHSNTPKEDEDDEGSNDEASTAAYHVLVSLMLSSQTKDVTNFEVMAKVVELILHLNNQPTS